MIHDGDRYFEYCYGADFEPRLSAMQKEACWQAWIAHYTRHQPAQRVDYAMRRVEALQSGEPLLSLPGLRTHEAGATALASSAQVLPAASPGSATAEAGTVPNGCLEACIAYEAHCLDQCPEDSVSCRHGCTRERAICLGGCH
jgi:hypothetical protein